MVRPIVLINPGHPCIRRAVLPCRSTRFDGLHRPTVPPSRCPTVSTERSPRGLLSPFKFPHPWDRYDRPRLLDFLAAVPPFCSSHSPCTSCHPSVLVSPPRVSFFSSCESHVCLRLAVRRVSLPCSCRSPLLASVSAAAVAYLRSVPLRRIPNVRHGGWCGDGIWPDCRSKLTIRFGWLSHVAFLFDLPQLQAFFSPLRCDLFFLCYASLQVTLYDNLRPRAGYGRKTNGFANWKGGF